MSEVVCQTLSLHVYLFNQAYIFPNYQLMLFFHQCLSGVVHSTHEWCPNRHCNHAVTNYRPVDLKSFLCVIYTLCFDFSLGSVQVDSHKHIHHHKHLVTNKLLLTNKTVFKRRNYFVIKLNSMELINGNIRIKNKLMNGNTFLCTWYVRMKLIHLAREMNVRTKVFIILIRVMMHALKELHLQAQTHGQILNKTHLGTLHTHLPCQTHSHIYKHGIHANMSASTYQAHTQTHERHPHVQACDKHTQAHCKHTTATPARTCQTRLQRQVGIWQTATQQQHAATHMYN